MPVTRVLEKTEDIHDEQGRKGWNVCIDLMENAYSRRSFSVYTEEQYWTIGADGTKKRYSSENEWKKNAGYVYRAYEALGWK